MLKFAAITASGGEHSRPSARLAYHFAGPAGYRAQWDGAKVAEWITSVLEDRDDIHHCPAWVWPTVWPLYHHHRRDEWWAEIQQLAFAVIQSQPEWLANSDKWFADVIGGESHHIVPAWCTSRNMAEVLRMKGHDALRAHFKP